MLKECAYTRRHTAYARAVYLRAVKNITEKGRTGTKKTVDGSKKV